jgi:hypothetical protein
MIIMPRLTGPGSLTSLAVKSLLALALALTTFVIAPAAASAAPTDAVVAPLTGGWHVTAGGHADGPVQTNSVFTCNWFSRTPFQIVDFTCQVTQGVIRVYIICSNGQRINSAPLPAVGTYNVRLTCPGVRVQTVGWETLA